MTTDSEEEAWLDVLFFDYIYVPKLLRRGFKIKFLALEFSACRLMTLLGVVLGI